MISVRMIPYLSGRAACIGLILMLSGGQAVAGDGFSISGFGTVAVTYNTSDDFEFIRDFFQPSGAEGGATTKVDSNLGVQFKYDFRPDTEIVVQVLSRHDEGGSIPPEITWAYVKHVFNPNWEIRAGRLSWDVYMLSDSRNVGYSYLWTRPPIEYFGFQQVSHIDGLDAVFTRPLGPGIFWFKVYGGRADEEVPLDEGGKYDVSGSRVLGGHGSYQVGDWWFRLGYSELKLDKPLESIQPLLAFMRGPAGNPTSAALANDIQLEDATIGQYVLGTVYERGDLQIQLMLDRAESDTLLVNDFYAGYATVSYRLGEWSPFISFAAIETDKSSRASGFPPGSPPDRQIRTAIDETRIDQHTTSVGVRYDFMENTALKFQVDRLWAHDSDSSMMRNAEPDWDGRATILTMSLDFVF